MFMFGFDHRTPKKKYIAIGSLHKFWMRANLMKLLFLEELEKKDKNEFHLVTYMDFWHGSLNIVAEGYIKLKIKVPEIDNLISDKGKCQSLKLYRHGTFHYFESYYHNRLQLLNMSDIVEWIYKIHDEFGNYLYSEMIRLQKILEKREKVSVYD